MQKPTRPITRFHLLDITNLTRNKFANGPEIRSRTRIVRPGILQQRSDQRGPRRRDGRSLLSLHNVLGVFLVAIVGVGGLEGHCFPEEDGEGVDIGRFAVGFAEGYFGSHVAAGAGATGGVICVCSYAVFWFEFFGKAKVKDFDVTRYVKSDVFWF